MVHIVCQTHVEKYKKLLDNHQIRNIVKKRLILLTIFLYGGVLIANEPLNKSLGDLVDYQYSNNRLELKTTFGVVNLTYYTPQVVRLQADKEKIDKPFSYAVIEKPENVKATIEDKGDHLEFSSSAIVVTIQKKPVRFTFIDKTSGKILNTDDKSFGISWIGDESTVYKKLQPDERFIGLGEQVGHLDRRGTALVNWNTDNPNYDQNSDRIYSSIPFYIGIHDNGIYGIFLDNTSKTRFNFGAANNRFSSFSANYGEVDYYFIAGKNVASILNSYCKLTGFSILPAKWSLGYQQCRYSYFPDSDVLSTAKKFRERKIPADMIYLDIHYMDHYKVFTWSPEKFPDPQSLIHQLKDIGFNTAAIFDPGIKIEKGYKAYDEGMKDDIFVKYPDGTNYAGQVWPGWCYFPDFTNPKARQWWGEQFTDDVKLGLTGFWNDMNEIAAWGKEVPGLIEFNWEGHKTSYKEAKNVYGLLMARSTYEGTKKLLNGKRPFVLTRAAYSGLQRYSAIWTGDNQAKEDHMLLGIRMLNSLGLSGVTFCGYDIGGFGGNPTQELYTRWMTIGAFSPMYRGHTAYGTMHSEPWVFGERAEDISRRYIQLRYRLMPYIYSSFYEATQTGMPVNRSLAINYTYDDNIYDPQFENQYLFGDDILVAPVKGNEQFCKVYLPKGEWYSLFDDKVFNGDSTYIVEAPLEKLPVFIKEGAIVPMQNNVQNLKEKGDGILYLHLYKGRNKTSFLLYEDDGTTFGYEKGQFAKRKIEYDPDQQTLTLEKTDGSYPSDFKKIKLILHGFGNVKSVKEGSQNLPVSVGKESMLTSEFPFLDYAPKEKVKVSTVETDLSGDQTIFKLTY